MGSIAWNHHSGGPLFLRQHHDLVHHHHHHGHPASSSPGSPAPTSLFVSSSLLAAEVATDEVNHQEVFLTAEPIPRKNNSTLTTKTKGAMRNAAAAAAAALGEYTTTTSITTPPAVSTTKVYLAYDGRMTLHKPVVLDEEDEEDDDEENLKVMERPERVRAIYGQLMRMPAAQAPQHRFLELACIPASREAIQLVHSAAHYDRLQETAWMSDDELHALTVPDDLFFGRETFYAARMAVGGVLECVKAVTRHPHQSPSRRSESSRAIAVVRPPGHHALHDEAMGFCYFNNVAVAAKHAIVTGRAKRVFILDWDIHHGNGIQDLTYDDPSIFYASIHRGGSSPGESDQSGESEGSGGEEGTTKKDRKKNYHQYFYPGTGRPNEVGAAGTNLNIAWDVGGMGDEEYTAAFTEMVIPAMQHFRPDLIIVACGLDAVKGDLIGDCGLSEDMFYHMTRMLIDATTGSGIPVPMVMALEGGYNVEASANCMEKVALALLDEPLVLGPRYLSVMQEADEEEEDAAVVDAARSRLRSSQTSSNNNKKKKINTKKKIKKAKKMGRRAKRVYSSAMRSIQRSAQALERKGGMCVSGCHYKCKHVSDNHALPLKKRKRCHEHEQPDKGQGQGVLTEGSKRMDDEKGDHGVKDV